MSKRRKKNRENLKLNTHTATEHVAILHGNYANTNWPSREDDFEEPAKQKYMHHFSTKNRQRHIRNANSIERWWQNNDNNNNRIPNVPQKTHFFHSFISLFLSFSLTLPSSYYENINIICTHAAFSLHREETLLLHRVRRTNATKNWLELHRRQLDRVWCWRCNANIIYRTCWIRPAVQQRMCYYLLLLIAQY